ncbi:MAG: Xaa-Pro peptidase family protein [Nitrospinota bacterium]|nr:Xaa-Pro peptidase family protein [Nitrospinota bacterium]
MNKYPTWARGSMMVDWEHRIDFERMRKERIQKTQDAMKEQGIDALVLWKDENVRYLTSLRAIMIQYRSSTTYGVLLHQEGDPTLLASSGEAHRIEQCMPWIKDYVPIGILEEPGLVDLTVKDEILPRLKDWDVANKTIGLDGHTFMQRSALEKHLPEAKFVDGERFMYLSRINKTPDEVACLMQACAIADSVTMTAIENSKPGVREYDVAAEAMKTLFTHGGEFGHLASPFVASGEHMAPPTRFPTDKIIRNGDVVFIDIGACWNGYFGDCGRATLAGGPPHPMQQKVYTTVYKALKAGIAKMKPGYTNDDSTQEFIEVARSAGLENNFIKLFIGHGCGISPNEPPYVGEVMPGAEKVEFEPGMTFAIEPLIFVDGIPGGAGVRIEDHILVTEDEPVYMTRAPYCDKLLLQD